MRRLSNWQRRERGAVAVIVAIWMVVFMGFAALAIDLGSAYSEQQQLQNGADAAALSIAEGCARGACVDTADTYAKANKLDGVATGHVVGGMAAPVTVEAEYTRQNWFAGVIGVPSIDISARATATWGWPSGGATLPLTFSWCAFKQATGGWDDQGKPLSNSESVIHMTESTCTPPAHNEVPGGFGWLTGVDCVAIVLAGNWVMSDPGNDGSGSCKDYDWTTLHNKTVLMPIFEDVRANGRNAEYKIKGLASFTITGYCFNTSAQWNVNKCPSDKRIIGHFSSYVDLSGSYTIDPLAPHFGVAVVKLSG
jgi:hypothetical protein